MKCSAARPTGNAEIEKAVGNLYQQEASIGCQNGIDGAMLAYINQANAVAKKSE